MKKLLLALATTIALCGCVNNEYDSYRLVQAEVVDFVSESDDDGTNYYVVFQYDNCRRKMRTNSHYGGWEKGMKHWHYEYSNSKNNTHWIGAVE